MQPPFILIENYFSICNILTHIEKNYKLELTSNKNLNNLMIINYDYKMNDYFRQIAQNYNGHIIQYFPDNKTSKYLIILYDINILEYLNLFYSNININYHINNKLYQDFINLYNNQSLYLEKNYSEEKYLI
jgi:hypothetical protein